MPRSRRLPWVILVMERRSAEGRGTLAAQDPDGGGTLVAVGFWAATKTGAAESKP
jgi:hypothetical protein